MAGTSKWCRRYWFGYWSACVVDGETPPDEETTVLLLTKDEHYTECVDCGGKVWYKYQDCTCGHGSHVGLCQELNLWSGKCMCPMFSGEE